MWRASLKDWLARVPPFVMRLAVSHGLVRRGRFIDDGQAAAVARSPQL